MELADRLRETADRLPVAPPGDPAATFRRGRRRRQRRRAGIAAAAAAGVIAITAVGLPLLPTGGSDSFEVADQPGRADEVGMVERAPVAGEVAAHWPAELQYTERGDQRHLLRFLGASWADWSLEVLEPSGSWRLLDREHPDVNFESEGGVLLDGEAPADMAGYTRVPSAVLNPGWRENTGLSDRVVVELDDLPAGSDVVARLGLDPGDVEAYVSPNILGCDRPLGECVPEGEIGARGLAHLPTGFPLYAEEGVAGEEPTVWLEAVAIRWADPGIGPVPLEQIPPAGG